MPAGELKGVNPYGDRGLLCCGERDVAATEIKTVVPRRRFIRNDLQRVGVSQLGIAGGGGAQEFVACDVHDYHAIACDKAETVGSWREDFISDLEMNLIQEISLVGLLNGGRVTGGVHQGEQGEVSTHETNSGRVAPLNGCAQTFIEDGLRQNSGSLRAIENARLEVWLRC